LRRAFVNPTQNLAAAGSVVVALALRHVQTPDAEEINYALGDHQGHAQDLADELSGKIRDWIRRERACRLALRPLSAADGQSLGDLADEAILRKLKARTPAALLEALREALLAVDSADALGWFDRAGYVPA